MVVWKKRLFVVLGVGLLFFMICICGKEMPSGQTIICSSVQTIKVKNCSEYIGDREFDKKGVFGM